jgi:hypothetical protein
MDPTNIAAEALVRSPPDGYTLLCVTISNAVNATLYDKLSFDLKRDIVPIASITRSRGVLEVKDASRVHRICESQPGQDQYGLGRLFKIMTGVDVVQVHTVAALRGCVSYFIFRGEFLASLFAC